MQYDLCKPAPYISHKSLLLIRVSVAVLLLAESIFTICVEGPISFAYFSEWSLYMSTICFALMAYSQVVNVAKMNEFAIDIKSESLYGRNDSLIQDTRDNLESMEKTRPKKPSFFPKLIILLYAACFSFCL